VNAVWEKTIVQTSSVDTGGRRGGPAGHRALGFDTWGGMPSVMDVKV
jgi:hypothetical protein